MWRRLTPVTGRRSLVAEAEGIYELMNVSLQANSYCHGIIYGTGGGASGKALSISLITALKSSKFILGTPPFICYNLAHDTT